MKIYTFLTLILMGSFSLYSQKYEFTPIIDLDATEVVSQGITGTCWSFSTTSFLESEIIRKTGKFIDLSEMYSVRQTYPKKAWNYLMRQGNAQFSQGGLAHDVINSARDAGLVPQEVYTGYLNGQTKYNHIELEEVLKNVLDTYIENPANTLSPTWKTVVEGILDSYLGKQVESFTFEGTSYTPKSFMEMVQINPDDYISLTSFTHQPYNSKFILNIPDNFSNGSFYNLPLDDLMQVITHALENGYTVELDCDVSEKTFSAKHGVAVIPEDESMNKEILTEIRSEKAITPDFRQQEFENFHTTDDHLMHITGLAKDQKGNTYFKVKNSWGTDESRVTYGGYVYFSEAYMRLKAISILIHKEALPKGIKQRFGIQ
ncbi:C1 family peptidase [Mangrovimonas futianensis]|uniref:C1 family peptidase n=1 Tax=Mangrovimonas futianensis TaxID=2895523 RepID=UPI001E2D9FD2|nr:C1 family peptidase [Mangrovimonas futianensis]MCF1421842.1 C1 family peptidase [Mangrovimonas futianensis]